MKLFFCFFVSLSAAAVVLNGCASTPTPPRVFVKPLEARPAEVFVYDQKPWAPETRTVPVEQWPGGSADPRWYQTPAQDAPAAVTTSVAAVQATAPVVGYQQYPASVQYFPPTVAYYPSYGYGGWYGGGYSGYGYVGGDRCLDHGIFGNYGPHHGGGGRGGHHR